MKRILVSVVLWSLAAGDAGAAARRPAKKTASVAEVMSPAVTASGPGQVTMRPMTLAEQRAHAIWTLRAALNVAALQCQYSPSLATVRNYNDFLRQHGGELAGALTTMTGHFRRLDGPRAAQNSFDQYTTRTYNAFSTLDTQLTFCEAAGTVGRDALQVPKGRLAVSADALNISLHAGLVQAARPDPLRVITPEWAVVEPISAPRR